MINLEEFILKLKYSYKKLIVLSFFLLLLCSMQASAACTAVYVGQDVSDDGSIIFARSNDFRGVLGDHITVSPRVENTPGRFVPVDFKGTVKTELPATTYKYTATPFMNSTMEAHKFGLDAAACTNEYGVAMSMSVSSYLNNASREADPHVKEGICEFTANDLVICQSKTAREAVEVLFGYIDKYGNAESNIAIISDQNETWYVEMYGGHQYAAVKLPKDKVAVFGNEYSLEYLSDYEDSITSENLTKLPEEKGFAVHGSNGELNLYDTYSGKEITDDYSHLRTWEGHRLLAPSKYASLYNHNAMYPLCFTPDKNVSAHDVENVLRDRYEGTIYSPDEAGRKDVRVIGSDTTLSAHVIQVFPDLPADMSCVNWISSGPPLYGVYVPVSNDCINVTDAYGSNQPSNETYVFDTNNYPYYVFKDLCTRCVGPDNHKVYGKPVQDYWNESEGYMFTGMKEVLSNAAKMSDNNTRASYITSYCNDMQTKAFLDAKVILNNVTWVQSKYSNTLKFEHHSDAPQKLGKPVVHDPIELNLDASKYKYVPPAN